MSCNVGFQLEFFPIKLQTYMKILRFTSVRTKIQEQGSGIAVLPVG
jgi:hypothetical protein